MSDISGGSIAGSRQHHPVDADGLDELDALLLAALRAEPTRGFRALARELGASERTIARRYSALASRGVVRVVGRTHADFGGQVAWLVRARTAAGRVESLARAVAAHGRSRWVRATRDRAELVYGLVSPDEGADPVLQRFADLPGVREVVAHELLRTWGPAQPTVTAPVALDDVDRAILRALAIDGRASHRELARRVGAEETTVARRRRRLEETGVLFYEADVMQAAFHRHVDAMLWLRVRPGSLVATGEALRDLPECTFVAATTGPTTMAANVAAASRADLLTLVDERLAGLVDAVEVSTLGRTFKRLPGGGPVG